ncbi:hypothetical protein BH23ACT11_BH23ACT11_01510 [soil metagenome]
MSVSADLVSGILPVREDGRVLLLLRPTGTWDPPAGRLATGENFEQGAIREVHEETGLLINPQRPLATWVGEGPNGGRLAAVTFIGRTLSTDVRLSHEHLDYRWATVEEWLKLPSWWSHENRRRVWEHTQTLPEAVAAEPAPPDPQTDDELVHANLGAGTVLVAWAGGEPVALLLRRRKPPAGLWENPGGMLEPGEDFLACARRETLEETGLDAEPADVWWARVEPWRGPGDPEVYAGAGFLARHPGGRVHLEDGAHDDYLWATEEQWRSLPTWYGDSELDYLWSTISSIDFEGEGR